MKTAKDDITGSGITNPMEVMKSMNNFRKNVQTLTSGVTKMKSVQEALTNAAQDVKKLI